MSQYYDNFNGATVGAGHPDFSVLFGDLTITTESTSILPGSDAHLLLEHVDGSFVRSAVGWNVGTTSGETTIRALVEFRTHGVTTGSISGAILSATGGDTTYTGYAQWYRVSDYTISRYDGGSDTTVPGTSGGTENNGLVQKRYVEMYRNGSLVEVRTWLYDGGTRPSAADVSYDDPSPLPVAGAFGLSHLTSTNNSGFRGMRIYEIAVATDGDALPDGPTLPTLRKGSQFTVETTLTGSMTGTGAGATLNGNAITVDSQTGTTVTLTDTDGTIATSGAYDLVLTDDTAATETISVQVNVVGIAGNTLRKNGVILADLTDVEVIVMSGVAGSRAISHNTADLTSDASGATAAVEVTDLSLNASDPVFVVLHSSSEVAGIPFDTSLELI